MWGLTWIAIMEVEVLMCVCSSPSIIVVLLQVIYGHAHHASSLILPRHWIRLTLTRTSPTETLRYLR